MNKNKNKNKFKETMKEFRESKRSSVVVYLILRALIIFCGVFQLLRGNFQVTFLCIFALLLLTMPIILQKKFKMVLPNTLEIIIFLFIFSAQILGEIFNFYGNVPHWDTMLHTINGFLCAGIGFALVDLLNENAKSIKLSPLYLSLAAFCFSMTVGVCWEFFEYSLDKFMLYDTQKDTIVTTISTVWLDPTQSNSTVVIKEIAETILYDSNGNVLTVIEGGYLDIGINDTMKDLFVNLIGAVVFSTLGFFYVKNREKHKISKHFIPEKAQDSSES
ncbi:MAG: hypothetical protein FWH05_08250 [Oscillospiraceae bacterium]|nr:hypothetical protein [Oscillospiraceae bacterium]